MEMHQVICDNLGMSRDMSISSLSKGEDGSTNFAFENHNIRILAVNDNTKFSVTNEKSTKYEGLISGTFLGGCTCGRYLIIFAKDSIVTAPRRGGRVIGEIQNINKKDVIYRLEYKDTFVEVVELYRGDLGFSLNHPIEAISYYESEDVQKVYWVDGINKNRMINIIHTGLEHSFFNIGSVFVTPYYYFQDSNIKMANAILYAFGDKSGKIIYYGSSLEVGISQVGHSLWKAEDIEAFGDQIYNMPIEQLPTSQGTSALQSISSQYNDYSFDFQGRINYIPNVTITKHNDEVGTFQAGVIQYFMTYYRKFGTETCIVWSSDLQYLTPPDRGGKADEAVSCSFRFSITNIEEDYDFLRIYACYRSGLNGVVTSRIVADIDLSRYTKNSVITFTDFGNQGSTFNSDDIPYLGGQDIRANTLEYKQDTMFLGDITIADAVPDIEISKAPQAIAELNTSIQIPGVEKNGKLTTCLYWAYKYVSPVAKEGVYVYDQEINRSQENIAGFKWREVYRFGIQFMDNDGAWTSAYWLGDKFCDLSPRVFTQSELNASTPSTGFLPTIPGVNQLNCANSTIGRGDSGNSTIYIIKGEEGCYIATAIIDVAALKSFIKDDISNYIAYRLLVANTDSTNRRIIEQGVVNPTMFNYVDRQYNRPFSIPSWIFRPRKSDITHRHYDTLPEQNSTYAELQGIKKKQIPGYADNSSGSGVNSYMFIIGVNSGTLNTGYVQWKLIYYNAGDTPEEKADLAKLLFFTGDFPDGTSQATKDSEYASIANIIYTYCDKRKIYLKKKSIKVPKRHSSNDDWKIVKYSDGTKRSVESIIKCLKDGYLPFYVYGDIYHVVSSRIYDNDYNHTLSYYDTLRDKLVELITDDQKKTTSRDVGAEFAGKIVLDPAMLPDADLLKQIGNEADVNGAAIAAAIAAAIVAAASVVLSALSFGAAAPLGALATNAMVSVAASLCAAGSIGLGAEAATMVIADKLNDLTKSMRAKGYFPIDMPGKGNDGVGDFTLPARQKRALAISAMLEKFFTPKAFDKTGWMEERDGGDVLVLKGEINLDTDVSGDKIETEGKVPFTCGHPYTERNRLGEDYNAFVISGKLSDLDKKERDNLTKQNLFCVDESIVTLNAPDIEENYSIVNNSDALRLDLVGLIPIHATQGIYSLSVGEGLNSNSHVLQGRFTTSPMDKDNSYAKKAVGLLNGYIYQDFYPGDSFSSRQIQVNENIESYKVFMWNKKSAGWWFPGKQLLSPIDSSKITSRKSIINNKIFANMRYSRTSLFYTPTTIEIDRPVACVDSQAMLKSFIYKNDVKNYYENVDTVSINYQPYSLVKSNGEYHPSTEGDINAGQLKDPISIRYKETPHILLPFKDNIFKYKDASGKQQEATRSTILPKLADEELTTPSISYKNLNGIVLDGTSNIAPQGDKYIFLSYYYRTSPPLAASGDAPIPTSPLFDGKSGVLQGHEIYYGSPDSSMYCRFVRYTGFLGNEGHPSPIQHLLKYILFVAKMGDPPYSAGANGIFSKSYWYVITSIGYNRWKVQCIDTIPVNVRLAFYNVPLYVKKTRGTATDIPEEINKRGIAYNSYFKDTDSNVLYVSNGDDDTRTKILLPIVRKSGFTIKNSHFQNWEKGNEELATFVKGIQHKSSSVINYPYYLDTEGKPWLTGAFSDSSWKQVTLNWKYNEGIPYLFLGELVKEHFDYSTWNGGTSRVALQQLVWNVASKVTPIKDNIINTWGDTYYQRWDCEKTYPFSEQEVNSNVEILSFMLESHINLDGRSDINRGVHNLLNTRPSNTVFNDVYSQKDNFFTYQILDEKFSSQEFNADIVWSLTKNNLDDIDKWTCLLSTNEMSLDGRYGNVRKILNVNDVLIAFQDTGITQIRYNETAALNTTSGLPLQMGNTGKVDGYRIISDSIGCHNKYSINKNSAGVFFADDFGKSFNQFIVQGGIADISTKANFSNWFKKNLNGSLWTSLNRSNFRTSYDEITHDLYIISNDKCLVYNTLLQKFTSFMDYIDTPMIARMISERGKSDTFALRSITRVVDGVNKNIIEIWKMFSGASDAIDVYSQQGAYGYIYGEFRPYSMEYRINPDPFHDSIFTNYQYAADWIDPNKEVDDDNVFNNASRRYTTFDTVEAKNEYQQGILNIQQNGNLNGQQRVFGRQPVKSMFRLWRGNIPRNGDTLAGGHTLDRMRNPWIHLKFTKTTVDDSKMTFHNLMVNYYNQYGRY